MSKTHDSSFLPTPISSPTSSFILHLCIFTCAWVYMYTPMDMHMNVNLKWYSSRAVHIIFCDKVSHWDLVLANMANLAGQPESSRNHHVPNPLGLGLQHGLPCLTFYVSAGLSWGTQSGEVLWVTFVQIESEVSLTKRPRKCGVNLLRRG